MSGTKVLSIEDEIDDDRLEEILIAEKENRILIIPTESELESYLCNFCNIEKDYRGVRNFSGSPHFCSDTGQCEVAYENYLQHVFDEAGVERSE